MEKVNISIDEQCNLKNMINEIINKIKTINEPSEISIVCAIPFGMSKIYTKKGQLKESVKKTPNSEELEILRNTLYNTGHKIVNVEYRKKTKLYAIKEGKGVKNKIVDSWDECKKYVHGYSAVYKSFFTLEECNDYLGTVNVEHVKECAKYAMENKNKIIKDKSITIKISKEMYDDLELKCKNVGLPKDKIIRFALNNYLYSE